MQIRFFRDESLRIAALVFVAVLVSVILVSTRIYENEDVEFKWAAVAAWAHGDFPAYAFNHHNLRWGMNAIGVVWVMLFDDSPLSYLALNYVVFSASTAGIYWLARSMSTRGVAAIVMAIWLLNPILYNLPSNFMPELYGQFYIVLALVLMRLAYLRDSRILYACSMFALFCLYGAKETNVFFMPGLALWELLRRRWDFLAIMVAVFVVGLGVETLTVNWIGQDQHLVLGRLQALVQGRHVNEMQTIFSDVTPSDVLGRWSLETAKYTERNEMYNANLPSKVLYLCFFALAPVLSVIGWRRSRGARKASVDTASPARPIDPFVFAVIAMGASFAFCTTFFILSFNPFTMGQPLVDRYLWILLTPVLLTIGAAIMLGREWMSLQSGQLAGLGAKFAAVLAGVLGWIDRRSVVVLLAAIVAGTGVRYYVDGKVVERRQAEQPYAFFDANDYWKRSVRDPLEAGCTLVFITHKASWSAMIFGFPYGTFTDPGQLYAEKVDGLTTRDGARVRAWQVPVADLPDVANRMHVDGGDLRAIKFENGRQCDAVSYLGHIDIPLAQQPVEGGFARTPAPVQP